MLMMNCNGKTYPMKSTANFDMTVFGDKSKARIDVAAKLENKEWKVTEIAMKSRNGSQVIF